MPAPGFLAAQRRRVVSSRAEVHREQCVLRHCARCMHKQCRTLDPDNRLQCMRMLRQTPGPALQRIAQATTGSIDDRWRSRPGCRARAPRDGPTSSLVGRAAVGHGCNGIVLCHQIAAIVQLLHPPPGICWRGVVSPAYKVLGNPTRCRVVEQQVHLMLVRLRQSDTGRGGSCSSARGGSCSSARSKKGSSRLTLTVKLQRSFRCTG